MARSNTSTSKPPIHSKFPWLVYSHGEQFNTQTFYDIEGGNCYIKQIPNMSNKRVYANSHGWMVMLDLDLNADVRIFLLNPVSMEKIILPPWKSSEPKWVSCILSLPPSDPKCIVAFFASKRPYIMFCHPSDKVWREEEFDMNNGCFGKAVSCEGKIYCRNGVLDNLMELRVSNNYMLEMIELVESPKDALVDGGRYLVESLGEIFLVIVTLYKGFKNRVRDVYVYQLDLRELEWIRVNNLGDHRVFFLSDITSMSCSSIGSSGSVSKNSIYFTLPRPEEVEMTSMYVYNMEEKTVTTCLVVPNDVQNVSKGQWIMSNL